MNQPIEDGEPHGRDADGPLNPHRGLVVGLTLAAILLSFATSLSFRSEHFQELDSYSVYAILQDPKESALSYTSWSYLPAAWGSPSRETREADDTPVAARIVDDWTPDWALETLRRQPIFERYYRTRAGPDIDARTTAEIRAFLVAQLKSDERLKRLPLHGLYRFGLIIGVSTLPLPDVVERALLVPLASTISVGPGLLYSAIYGFSESYREFMDYATLLTITIFYISSLLLFLFLLNTGINIYASSISILLFVFSISIYSYAFHLGNTIWSLAAASIFLYAAATSWGRTAFAARVSWSAAVLVLFSYLIVVYYIAALVLEWAAGIRRGEIAPSLAARALSASAGVLAANRAGIASTLAVAVLFFQTGQGLRGVMRSVSEAPDYLYYSILNYVALVNGVGALNAVQFAVGGAAFCAGAAALCRKPSDWGLHRDACASLIVATAGVYLAFVAAGLLNIAPTRHILFVAPVFIAVIAVGIAWCGSGLWRGAGGALGRMRPAARHAAGPLALVAWSLVGFTAQQTRFAAVTDPTAAIAVPAEIEGVVGNALPVAWDAGKPVLRIKDALQRGGRFLYASTDAPFASWLVRVAPDYEGVARIAEIEDVVVIQSRQAFTAFVPRMGDGRFAFTRPNSLYITLFQTVGEPAP